MEMKEVEDARRRSREESRKMRTKGLVNHEVHDAFKKRSDLMQMIFPKTLDFDNLLYSQKFEAPYNYERYMGRIKVKEAPADVNQKGLIDHESTVDNVFLKDTVYRKMQVAGMDEKFFKNHLSGILKVFRDHLEEKNRVRELFSQFKPIYQGEMLRKVRSLLNRQENSLDLMTEYQQILAELRRYRAISWELPETVSFPMFEIGVSVVKAEIQKRIKSCIVEVLKKFESDLQVRAMKTCESFQEISDKYQESLTTAEEVVDMETFKSNL